MSGYLTPDELAELLRVARSHIDRSVATREYPHSRVGRYVRFSEDDVAQIKRLIRVEAKTATDEANPYDFKGKAS